MMYLPVKREKIVRPPWGYTPSPDDPYLLLPINDQLKALDEGMKMLDRGASLRKTALWVSKQCGVQISQTTLKNLYEKDPTRDEAREKRKQLIGNYTSENIMRKRKHGLTEEKKELRKLNRLNSSVTRKKKKLKRLREEQAAVQDKLEEVKSPPKTETTIIVPAEPANTYKPIEIKPNPGPQTDFLAATERICVYGGAAGGGKSFAITIDPLRTIHLSSHRSIIFRKTIDDLRELIGISKEIYPKIDPGAKWNDAKSTWTFSAGGTAWYRYLDRDDDVQSMQGQSFTHVGFDELGQWASPYCFDYMVSRVRTTDPEIRPYLSIRGTTNPGGPGSWWIKKRFIDPAPWNTPFVAVDIEGNELRYPANHAKAGQPLYYARFIPARLSDNPYLYNDGSYEAGLLSLPEIQRRQLLDGDWDVCEGAAFTEFNRRLHVCQPFDIPSHWLRFRAADWGYEQPGCVLWFAADPNGNLYVYREWYHKRVLASDVADGILEREYGENVRYGVLDASTWQRRGSSDIGPSIAETMVKRGCLWRPSDRTKDSRKFGKMEVHRRLQIKKLPDEITGHIVEKPNLVIFSTCTNLIRTLPTIPVDKTNPEDVDTDAEDHCYDALRYGLMSRPMTSAKTIYQRHFTPVQREPSYNAFGFPV